MFTGLIQEVGIIKGLRRRGNYSIVRIESQLALEDIAPGESISCDGACLTVVDRDQDTFEVEASQETAQRTILGTYRVGRRINLERALSVGDRLGGHHVTGHVDETGRVAYLRRVGDSRELAVTYSSRSDPLVVEKGSIAINGVSLTINAIRSGWLSVNLIPFTIRNTALGNLSPGAGVNLEFDILGKYVARMVGRGEMSLLTKQKLRDSGW